MATTIITKNGSGAPLDGDLSVGELAVDLTNKQLYTKDNGGVIKLGGSGNSGEWEENGDDIYYNDGNVGIGTASPAGSLEISRNASSGDAVYYPNIRLDNQDAAGYQGIYFLQSGALKTGIEHKNDVGALQFFVGGASERMRIGADGNVGIGIDSPSQTLHVRGDGGFGLNNEANSCATSITNSADPSLANIEHYYPAGSSIAFRTSRTLDGQASERMRIDASGRVGIGGEPSRSTKEIEDDAVSTLANWKTQIDDRLKAEPKADKKAVTLEITGEDKLPTKAELIKRLTERNIGGGTAKLQVAGDGYFSGTIYGPQITISDGSIWRNVSGTGGIAFSSDNGAEITPLGNDGLQNDAQMNFGRPAYRFKNGYFSGTVTLRSGVAVGSRDFIETLSTLRTATQDETTLEGLRDSIGNAIGGLIEKFEAMQNEVSTQDS